MFLPTTRKELRQLGWRQLDIILITGDAYIDSPFVGVSVIGKSLASKGFKVGIISQPQVNSDVDISRLGEPGLFWGVTSGSIDSMVANYTALKKRRKQDDYTPGGINNKRPDRAVIAYTNLIRRFFKKTRPIVLGGIEASLRRIAHYDFWSGKIRRSILFDAKADYLLFGMAHKSVVLLAEALQHREDPENVRGLAYISSTPKGKLIDGFETICKDNRAFVRSFETFYQNNDPMTAETLCQPHGDRFLILNPPAPYDTVQEMDQVHDLDYERAVHPFDAKKGNVRALETIRFSIPMHHGCYGECHFCAITVHQGRTVRWRSKASVLKEAERITRSVGFKGYIQDLGGPTANMYGFECKKKLEKGACRDRRCLFPKVCSSLKPDHSRYLAVIRAVAQLPGVKKVFVSSGIRYDMIMADKINGPPFLEKLVADHISGQMKIAPEHTQKNVLQQMGKHGSEKLAEFKKTFDTLSRKAGKKQFLTYYFIAAHPGCNMQDMQALKIFAATHLKTNPEQVQIFTPTPSTWSTLMYTTCLDPFSGQSLFVEKDPEKKQKQKEILVRKRFQRSRLGR